MPFCRKLVSVAARVVVSLGDVAVSQTSVYTMTLKRKNFDSVISNTSTLGSPFQELRLWSPFSAATRARKVHLCPEMHVIAKITNVIVQKIPKIIIKAKITKIANQVSDTGKYNKSLKESSENNKSSERHWQM